MPRKGKTFHLFAFEYMCVSKREQIEVEWYCMHEIKGKTFSHFWANKVKNWNLHECQLLHRKVDDLQKSSQQFRKLGNLKSLMLTDEKIPLVHNLHDVYVVVFFVFSNLRSTFC